MFPLTSNEAYIKSTGERSTLGYMFDGLSSGKANTKDLASIIITGTKNNTGTSIPAGTYFYLNGVLVKAKTDIANNATLTKNTNYTEVTAGALNDLNKTYHDEIELTGWASGSKAQIFRDGNVVWFMNTAGIVNMVNGNAGTVGTIPSGFRPNVSQLIAYWPRGSAAENNIRFVISKTDGSVGAYNYGAAITENSNGAFSLMWITEDPFPA